MPFNRFSVERVESLVIIHFGLLNVGNILLDRFSASIFQKELDALKENLMEYLGKVGSLGDAPAQWQAPPVLTPVALFNHVGVTSNPSVAELCLNNIVVRGIHELRQTTGGTMQVDPIILLRSTQDLQKHLLRELYPVA